jgi:hypothetical protein
MDSTSPCCPRFLREADELQAVERAAREVQLGAHQLSDGLALSFGGELIVMFFAPCVFAISAFLHGEIRFRGVADPRRVRHIGRQRLGADHFPGSCGDRVARRGVLLTNHVGTLASIDFFTVPFAPAASILTSS